MKLKGSLTTPTCGRFYGKKLNLVVLSQLVGFFNSLMKLEFPPMKLKFLTYETRVSYLGNWSFPPYGTRVPTYVGTGSPPYSSAKQGGDT